MNESNERFLRELRELTWGKVDTKDMVLTNLLSSRGIVLLDGYHDFLRKVSFARSDN